MSITPVYLSHKTLNYTDYVRLPKLCTHVDDWYLLAIGNYIESTTIEREILRQLLLINGYKILAQHLHPLLSKSFRAVSTFVWEVPIKTCDIDSGCTVAACWLLTVDCWLGVKKMKIARIICCELDSNLRPTFEARIWYHSGSKAGIDMRETRMGRWVY